MKQTARTLFRLDDFEKLSSSKFRYDNSVRYCRLSTPGYYDTASGYIAIESPYRIVGWCSEMPSNLMHGREGQIGLMFWHPEYEEVWEHYPLFDEESRDEARFFHRSNSEGHTP